MSTILYYSNYCESCKKLLGMISRSPIKDEMHFICIDKRSRHSNGQTYVQLSDGQEVLLPPKLSDASFKKHEIGNPLFVPPFDNTGVAGVNQRLLM